MRVESRCPECGVDIWSQPKVNPIIAKDAKNALYWGIASLVTYFICLGPFAAIVAIPAVTIGGRVRREVRKGRIPAEAASGASAGYWMGGAVIALSLFWLIVMVVIFAVGMGFTLNAPAGPLSGP